MKKQLLFLVMMLMPMVARAYDFEVDGFYYNITSLQELTVELTYGDVKYSGDVIIPSSVTYSNRVFAVNRLGDNVFKDCYDITSIDIPNTVVTTGAYTFYNCSNLTTLRIPFSMTDIGNSTACSNVGRYCFGGCWNLEHLVFDEGTENTLYIHPNDWYTGSIRTFVNCKLKSLYLGRNVSCTVLKSNGYYNPFYKQTELTEIQFGKDFNDIFFRNVRRLFFLKTYRNSR